MADSIKPITDDANESAVERIRRSRVSESHDEPSETGQDVARRPPSSLSSLPADLQSLLTGNGHSLPNVIIRQHAPVDIEKLISDYRKLQQLNKELQKEVDTLKFQLLQLQFTSKEEFERKVIFIEQTDVLPVWEVHWYAHFLI